MDNESEGVKMKKNNISETMGLLNILLMLKERIEVQIEMDTLIVIDEPKSCLYDSEHQMIVFKCESRIDIIPFQEVKNISVIKKGIYNERIF